MTKPKAKRKRDREMMAIRTPDDLRDALRIEADRRGLTVTDLVITVLSKWITTFGGSSPQDPLPHGSLDVAAHPRLLAAISDVRPGSDGPHETKGKAEHD